MVASRYRWLAPNESAADTYALSSVLSTAAGERDGHRVWKREGESIRLVRLACENAMRPQKKKTKNKQTKRHKVFRLAAVT